MPGTYSLASNVFATSQKPQITGRDRIDCVELQLFDQRVKVSLPLL